MSESNDTVDEDVTPVEPRPDIRLSVENGKHLEIDVDPVEWIIIVIGSIVIISLLGRFGLF